MHTGVAATDVINDFCRSIFPDRAQQAKNRLDISARTAVSSSAELGGASPKAIIRRGRQMKGGFRPIPAARGRLASIC